MLLPSAPTRRTVLTLLASAVWSGPGLTRPRFVMQKEPSLPHVSALVQAALRAADFAAQFEDAPITTEQRNLYETQEGRIHISLLPTTPERLSLLRQGKLRMVPIPLERGLLGWRACFVLRQDADKLKGIRTIDDLRRLTLGQGHNWWDAQVYRHAGITTREVPTWRDGHFARQMQAQQIDAFPMGLEESLNFFLPHFQKRYPDLVLDQHLLLHYPWYRVLWVSAHAQADALFTALNTGFERLVKSGRFEQLWQQLRPTVPAAAWRQRHVISLNNPWYDPELIAPQYRHLLLQPPVS